MARPKPTVLLSHTNDAGQTLDILAAEATWIITYDGRPINLREFFFDLGTRQKYLRTSYSNPGHARRLADKLNQRFNTDKFAVVTNVHERSS